MKRIAFVLLLLFFCPAAYAQESPKITITTKTGENLEGTFKGGTNSEIIIDIAGQELRLPIAKVRFSIIRGKDRSTTSSLIPTS
jgi:hypothetical protein